jgi:hypothetical protein
MPIATAITIIFIMVYIVLRAVSRTGKLLLKTLERIGGPREMTSTPTMFLGARRRGMTRWERRVSGGSGRS